MKGRTGGRGGREAVADGKKGRTGGRGEWEGGADATEEGADGTDWCT